MVTIEDLLVVAQSEAGADLRTPRQGKPFSVKVEGEVLIVYPAHTRTGKGTRLGLPPLSKMLQRFNETSSRNLADYKELSKNRSYSLPLIIAAFDRNSPG